MDASTRYSGLLELLNNYEVRRLFEKEADALDLECAICIEPFLDPYRIATCQHIFCKACIEQLPQETCPLCRREFKKTETVYSKLKQENIINLLNRIKLEIKESEDSLPRMQERKIDHLRSSSSNSLDQKASNSFLEQLDAPVSTQLRLKCDQMMQCIFSEIEEDQSEQNSETYAFKTKWDRGQKQKIDALRNQWRLSHANTYKMADYLSVIENMACRLANILKTQLNSLQLSGNSKGQNIDTRINSSGSQVTILGGGRTTIYLNPDRIAVSRIGSDGDLTELFSTASEIRSGNFSNQKDAHIYVNNKEVKRSEANFIRALTRLDDLLLECFSQRYIRNEFSKAFSALAKVSSESTEKQDDAIISFCAYCNDLLAKDDLQELVALFKEYLQQGNNIVILGKIYENLISLATTNREHIQLVMMSLDDSSIFSFKEQVLAAIQKTENIGSSLQLLSLCEDHLEWCQAQVHSMIKICIDKDQDEMAKNLIDKYLIKNSATRDKTLIYFHTMIKKHVSNNNLGYACQLIDKYLLSKPETQKEGMRYIEELIRYNVSSNNLGYTCQLADKYLLSKPETQKEGMRYIEELIRYNVSNNNLRYTCQLADKYLLNKPETQKEGMRYIEELIRYNVSNNNLRYTCQLADKYLLNKPETQKEGMRYIEELIRYNVSSNNLGYTCQLADKYLLSKPETQKEGMRYIEELIRYNVSNNNRDYACQLIDKYLLNRSDTKSRGLEYIKEMIRYNESHRNHQYAASLKTRYKL
jgi:zinc-RING finger domain